jgi:hypothetical protein
MAEIRTLDEIKTIVEAELRSHAGCGGAGVDLYEVTDRSAPYDWDVQTVNAGATHELEACELCLRGILPRLQLLYRLR